MNKMVMDLEQSDSESSIPTKAKLISLVVAGVLGFTASVLISLSTLSSGPSEQKALKLLDKKFKERIGATPIYPNQ